ncbi:TPA: hypothetical protein HA244_06870 [Candidatus Micrarchaeota archaeon]|nr:hypothetical protein [Candidatus Micrarchaeota archaeon]
MSGSSDWMFSLVLVVLAVGFVGGFFYNQGRDQSQYSPKPGGAGGYGSIGGGGSGLSGGGAACCKGVTGSSCSFRSEGCSDSEEACSAADCGKSDPNCFPITCADGSRGSVCYDSSNIGTTLC